ncbi:four helix bundle protein [Candidatus Omnitrophota bacterium]
MAFKFEKLEVWKRAIELSVSINELTKSFPRDELYILTSQIKRAADSIALNIAEGSTGQSNAEFKQFIGYALRSAVEVVSCLYLGKRRNLIQEDKFQALYDEVEVLIKMLQKLRTYLRKT